MTKKPPFVILGVTGGIAAYKACDVINGLRCASVDVQVVMTDAARQFITPMTLQTLSKNKVVSDMFELPDEWNPLHTAYADKADAVVIAPATACIIGKLAHGICDDLLTCIICATKAPVLIAPAMNDNMYNHPSVQNNIKYLRANGYNFIGPVKGRLACGRVGMGHCADPSMIVKETLSLLK